MNYKSYINLTIKQKEEYNFRFKDEVTYNYKRLLYAIILLIATLTNYMFFVYYHHRCNHLVLS